MSKENLWSKISEELEERLERRSAMRKILSKDNLPVGAMGRYEITDTSLCTDEDYMKYKENIFCLKMMDNTVEVVRSLDSKLRLSQNLIGESEPKRFEVDDFLIDFFISDISHLSGMSKTEKNNFQLDSYLYNNLIDICEDKILKKENEIFLEFIAQSCKNIGNYYECNNRKCLNQVLHENNFDYILTNSVNFKFDIEKKNGEIDICEINDGMSKYIILNNLDYSNFEDDCFYLTRYGTSFFEIKAEIWGSFSLGMFINANRYKYIDISSIQL